MLGKTSDLQFLNPDLLASFLKGLVQNTVAKQHV